MPNIYGYDGRGYDNWFNQQSSPTSSLTAPASTTPDMEGILNKAIPGFSGLTKSATGVIDSLLTGMPSPDLARQENAYFGAKSGLGSSITDPTHDFLRNRGFDLYGQKAEARRQTGIDDLLKFLGGYSGAVVPTTGETLHNQQFGQDLAFKEERAAIDNAMKQRELSERYPSAMRTRDFYSTHPNYDPTTGSGNYPSLKYM